MDETEKLLKIRRICAKNAVFIDDAMVDRLGQYARLLVEWNLRINLISRKDTENIWESHILHSLSILFEENIFKGASILDLGTGGGLPGIPISILRPDTTVTLLDATRKKVEAVRDMAEKMRLGNITTLWGRAEDREILENHGGQFDQVVARAVAPLSDLVRWTLPLIARPPRQNNQAPQLITLKGGDLSEEIENVTQMDGVKEVRCKALTFKGAENIPGIDKQIVSIKL